MPSRANRNLKTKKKKTAEHNSRYNKKDKQRRKVEHENDDCAMFGGEPVLCEALSYLDAVSIVNKKIVCRQWKDMCDVAINNRGRQRKKRFVGNKELRGAVQRYCKGNRDDTENIAEVYGYPIGKWDVSGVEDFSRVFMDLHGFNEDVGAWDVGKVTNMSEMFSHAFALNQDLSGWDVSSVRDTHDMFYHARVFNGNVSTWDTSSVTDMGHMFYCAFEFTGDVSRWDTSRVTNMRGMFDMACKFNGDLSAWDTSRVIDMSGMFQNAWAFYGNISTWDTSRVRYRNRMFYCDSIFVRRPISFVCTALFLVYLFYYVDHVRVSEPSVWNYSLMDYFLMVIMMAMCISFSSEKIETAKAILDIVLPDSLKPRKFW